MCTNQATFGCLLWLLAIVFFPRWGGCRFLAEPVSFVVWKSWISSDSFNQSWSSARLPMMNVKDEGWLAFHPLKHRQAVDTTIAGVWCWFSSSRMGHMSCVMRDRFLGSVPFRFVHGGKDRGNWNNQFMPAEEVICLIPKSRILCTICLHAMLLSQKFLPTKFSVLEDKRLLRKQQRKEK